MAKSGIYVMVGGGSGVQWSIVDVWARVLAMSVVPIPPQLEFPQIKHVPIPPCVCVCVLMYHKGEGCYLRLLSSGKVTTPYAFYYHSYYHLIVISC